MSVNFRFWDNEKQKMYYVAKLDMWGSEDNWTVDLCDESGDEQLFDVEIGQLELMQSIGIKDKNGQEIYESDILQVVNNLNETTQKYNTHNVVVKRIAGGFVASSEDLYSHFDDYNIPIVTFEIIGNVHKNPELLTTVVRA